MRNSRIRTGTRQPANAELSRKESPFLFLDDFENVLVRINRQLTQVGFTLMRNPRGCPFIDQPPRIKSF